MLGKKVRYLVIYLVLVAALVFLFQRMPTAYLPQEDQGIMYIQAMLPAGSTLEQTKQVLDQVRSHFLEDEKDAVEAMFTVAGRGFSGAGQNVGLGFVKLKDWDLRPGSNLKIDALVKRAMAKFSQIRNARVFAFPPPAVLELGRAGGFDFELQDRGGLGHEALMAARNQLLGHGCQRPQAGPRPAQRPGRCDPISHRCGLGKGGCPGGSHQLHPQHHFGGLRQRLRERLHPGRAGQAGLRPGRRALPDVAQRP